MRNKRSAIIERATHAGEIPADKPGGLRQQRTQALSSAFAVESRDSGRYEPEIARRQIEQLLDARAGVVQQGEQHIVALAVDRRAIHLRQQVGELGFGEVAEQRTRGLLDGNGQHALTREGALGMVVEDVPEEAVNRGQARIAGPYRIAPRRFEVREKLQDQIWGQILDLQRRDRSVTGSGSESQQQLEGVAIRRGGVRADIALRGEVADEEGGHEGGEIGASS